MVGDTNSYILNNPLSYAPLAPNFKDESNGNFKDESNGRMLSFC